MTSPDPLIAYLATHNVPCPGCDANLRGQDEPYCPKCHKDLFLGEIETWHAVFGDAKGLPAGPSRGAILAAMIARLEASNFSCVGCGYQLRGIKSPRCPECANRIRPYEVLVNERKPMSDAAIAAVVLAAIAVLLVIVIAMRR